MTTQPDPTHARIEDHIAELRDSAEEAQAARLEVVSEIARLTKALRQVGDERDAARADAERMFYAIKAFLHSRQSGNTGLSEYDRIIRELEESLEGYAAKA